MTAALITATLSAYPLYYLWKGVFNNQVTLRGER